MGRAAAAAVVALADDPAGPADPGGGCGCAGGIAAGLPGTGRGRGHGPGGRSGRIAAASAVSRGQRGIFLLADAASGGPPPGPVRVKQRRDVRRLVSEQRQALRLARPEPARRGTRRRRRSSRPQPGWPGEGVGGGARPHA